MRTCMGLKLANVDLRHREHALSRERATRCDTLDAASLYISHQAYRRQYLLVSGDVGVSSSSIYHQAHGAVSIPIPEFTQRFDENSLCLSIDGYIEP